MDASEDEHPKAADVARLSSLDDALRRRLYTYVCDQPAPVSRDQAAAAMDVGRTLAAYHLDKLAAADLLAVDYQRPAGRGGPGAGRPAKLYSRAAGEVSVSVPARDYQLLARLLVDSAENDKTGSVRAAGAVAAEQAGRDAVVAARASAPAPLVLDDAVSGALHAVGYEPRHTDTDTGDIELRNCPFHMLAHRYPDTVCALNLAFIHGVLEQASADPARAELAPRTGRCCVVIHAS